MAILISDLDKIIFVEVKNLHSTADRTPSGRDKNLSWKGWWEKHTGKKFKKCSCSTCNNDADVGAHVKKTDLGDGKWYIVPLCYKCNAKKDPFKVLRIDLMAVNEGSAS